MGGRALARGMCGMVGATEIVSNIRRLVAESFDAPRPDTRGAEQHPEQTALEDSSGSSLRRREHRRSSRGERPDRRCKLHALNRAFQRVRPRTRPAPLVLYRRGERGEVRTLLKAFRLAIPPTGGVMSFDAAAAARALYEALAEGDYEGAAQRVTDDVLLLNVATGDVHHGPAGFLAYMRGWSTAIPDLKLEPLEIAGSGTRALAEYEIRGNHSGPLVTPGGHVPSTGMDVQISFCDVLELEGELVSRIRSYFDSGTLLRQLGLLGGSPLHAPDRRAPLELYAQTMDENAPERNKAIVSRYVQDVLNRQNPQAAVDTCSRDIIWHGGPLGTVKGMKEYQAVRSSFFAAF